MKQSKHQSLRTLENDNRSLTAKWSFNLSALKQIKDQNYREIEMRERGRGTFDSRYQKQICSDKKIFPITNTKLVSFKRDKKRTYINMKICKDRERLGKSKYWGRGKVGKEEDILNVLVIEICIYNRQVIYIYIYIYKLIQFNVVA